MSNLMSMDLPSFEICLRSSHVFMFEIYFMYVPCFGKDDNFPKVYDGAGLYFFDETNHMSINILLLHDPHFYNSRTQQESLLLSLFLREYGLKSLHTHHDVLEGMYGTFPCFFFF